MTTQRDNLIDKIRALMSKTVENGCTEAEAMAALAKARAMIDAHEITDAELALTKAETAVLRSEPPGSKDAYQIKAYLVRAIGKFTDCKGWRSREGGIVFCGLPSDARFATWLMDSLAAFVRNEMASHLIGDVSVGADRKTVCRSFAMGCCVRISQRLEELCAQSATAATSNGRELVVVKSQAVADRMRQEGIMLRTGRASRAHLDGSAFAAGKTAGDRASFGRPVSGRNATLRLR